MADIPTPQPSSLTMLALRRSLLVLAALAVVAGCNVLEPIYDEGGDVESLLDDARYARADGDFDRAADLLEAAHEQEPENAEVRLELAGTLLQREGVNALDLVSEVVDFVQTYEAPTGSATASRGAAADSCSWSGAEPARAFEPTSFSAYAEVLEARPVLARVQDLLAGPDGGALPASLLALTPCDVFADGAFAFDRDGVLADLYATFGTPNAVRSALLLHAVSLTLDAYTRVFEQPDLPVRWFLVGEAERLGFCVAAPQVPLLRSRAEHEVQRLGQALVAFDLLVHDAGNATIEELRDEALALYETVEADLPPLCN